MKSTLAKIALCTTLATSAMGTAFAVETGPWCPQFAGASMDFAQKQDGVWLVLHLFPEDSHWESLFVAIYDKRITTEEAAKKRAADMINSAMDYAVGETLPYEEGTYFDRCRYLIPLKYTFYGDYYVALSRNYSATGPEASRNVAPLRARGASAASPTMSPLRALEKAKAVK